METKEATWAVWTELKLVQERRDAMMTLMDCLSAMLGTNVFLNEEKQVTKCTFANISSAFQYTDSLRIRSHTCDAEKKSMVDD